jgi:hypothetical protein
MRDDTGRRRRQTQVTDKHELSEDETSLRRIPEPIEAPEGYVKVRKWLISRVFYFLAFNSVVCLAAVAIAPSPIMKVAAPAVFLGSVGLAKFTLTGRVL